MHITSRSGLLGFLFSLSALALPATAAEGTGPGPEAEPASIDGRLSRIAAALRARRAELSGTEPLDPELLVAFGFADGGRGGSWGNTRFGGGAVGPGGGTFGNAHPYYGGGNRGFVNGGGGFVNAAYGGGFVNAPYRGGFVNATNPGGAFRNW